jgi:hypothetical protein
MREWIIRHPRQVRGILSGLAGAMIAVAWFAGEASARQGEADRLASEALGG